MSNTIKKLILCLVSVVLIFCGTVAVFAASSKSYVGNKSTKVYHISECTYASKISTKNRVYFPSRAAAEINGYRRCYYCGDGVVEPGNGGSHGSSDHSGSANNNNNFTKPTEENVIKGTVKESKPILQTIGNIIGIVIAIFCSPIILLIEGISALVQNYKKTKEKTPHANKLQLNSSVISEVEFQDNVIYITFQTGGVYAYYNVPRKVYDGLVASQSPGKYFHDHIKDKYPFAPYHK